MLDIQKIQKDIVDCLRPLEPEKIIVFGSYASGTPTEDSDIDLYVVTKDDFLPQSFEEQSRSYLKISRNIREIRKHTPVDLIVHTRKMHEKFIQMNSSFAKQIRQEGIRLL
jgi:predicted nucleotidyltransferase